MKKIGIVGSRRRDGTPDYMSVMNAFDDIYEKGDTIVSGGCPQGGDRFAEELAKDRGLSILIHYPDWASNGRAAGFARNGKIAEDCDILIACVAEDRKGGTEDTIKKAEKLARKVILV
jgi:hypothetical protein